MDGLFREEAVQARRSQLVGTVRLATPVSQQVWGVCALATTAALVAWLCLGHYTRSERVAGTLVPQTGLLGLSARTTGVITKLMVSGGERVSAGQALLAISGDRSSTLMGDTDAVIGRQLRAQEAQTRASLGDLKPQAEAQAKDLRRRIAMLQAQLRQIDAQRVLEQKEAAASEQLIAKARPLRARGIITVIQFDQYQASALSAETALKTLARQRLDTAQQVSSLRAQLAELPLATQTKANQFRSEIARLDTQLAQNAVERVSVLRAPRAGVVSSLLVSPGQTVSSGQPLLTILPKGSSLQAQLLVPSSAIGFVHDGTRVLLHYQAFPYQKFGVQDGTVVHVSRSALSQRDVAELLGEQAPPEPMYRVKVRLAKQAIDAYGKPNALLPGMSVDADLLLDRRRLIEWIFEPLYGMAKRGGGKV